MGRPRKNKVIEWEGVPFYKNASGYFMSNGKVYLHRAVWEKHHGPIENGFVIHHRDEDKSNNAIENLEMMPNSNHTTMHGLKRVYPRRPPCYCGEKHRAKGLCLKHYKRLWWRSHFSQGLRTRNVS